MSSRSLSRRHNQPARTPATSPHIPLLPVELLGLVTDELSTSTADLKSLSLASRAFLHFARRHIFRHLCVSLTPSRTMQDFETFLLHASWSIRNAVHGLTLRTKAFNWPPTDPNELPWQSISPIQLASFLTYLPRVEKLVLRGITIKGTIVSHSQVASTMVHESDVPEMTRSLPRHLHSLVFWYTKSTSTTAEDCLSVSAELFTIGTLSITNWSIDQKQGVTAATLQAVPTPATALRVKTLKLEAEGDLNLQGWIGLLTAPLKEGQEAQTSSLEELYIKCETDQDIADLSDLLSLVGLHMRELMLDMPDHMFCCDYTALTRTLALYTNCPALQVVTLRSLIPSSEDGDIEEDEEFVFCLGNIFETVASVATSARSPLDVRFYLAAGESHSTSPLAAIARHCSDILKLVHSGSIKHLELIFEGQERFIAPPDGVATQSLEHWVNTNLQADCVREEKGIVRWVPDLDIW